MAINPPLADILAVPPEGASRSQAEKIIAAWRLAHAARLDADHTAARLKDEENLLKSWLIRVFLEQKFEGIVLAGKITGLSTKEVHAVDDREAFIKYIYEREAIDLLQFRISDTAIFAREDAEGPLPGVRVEEVYGLFDRKA